ncbi:pyridoxal phosphate-dependent decarboxylase family protein [Cedecea sp. MMO-103]|uniref:pyridoxal phosphate-dependent decarboxylase family protein n=1 Tax=Cedecea sp. MMO-103 TaxID=3081238 RepID=UPI00301B6A29
MQSEEVKLIVDANTRSVNYLTKVAIQRVFPAQSTLDSLSKFDESLPEVGFSGKDVLEFLDNFGSPATVMSNGPRYFGYVVGASLPAAAAADRLISTWDQSGFSPVVEAIEKTAARWILDILDLPRSSTVGFGTSATACSLGCIATARRVILQKVGWDIDKKGLVGSPEISVVVSERIHVTLLKTLRILGFGENSIYKAPTDRFGRVDPERLPYLDDKTILCLQAGEVNTGEFDPFLDIIPKAKAAGSWVHIDGAFGLWARTSSKHRYLTEGIELADSWTTDGHKWLNTPYDSAAGICKDAHSFINTMNSDASYVIPSYEAQRNLTLEFSRKARGILIWAALRNLGRLGVASMIDKNIEQAKKVASALTREGFEVLNRTVLNQVLVRCADDLATNYVREFVERSGEAWFGSTVWGGRAAFRLSFSSWRTNDEDINQLITVLTKAYRSYENSIKS